ncbi:MULTISPECIES: flavin reductase family protein [unclassified Rhodococcus (in: high G+C Gram-positive bacteria)]|uniref:flavin reductase family protein n=1 Tax=unclassified Rhodococcus (in: high G+C Gram-positive bacteria) TaxID=192944 RepID=UPI0021C10F26|nr:MULTISPECIES: flavin reductase family protein [unclassified Rhodococcus (in: high G+C Gram-positive bacteria)]
MTNDDASVTLGPEEYRRVMGHIPTSVSIITARTPAGPAGMTVGTFTSVSLEPRLVAFYVDLASTTWPVIAEAAHFGINVLGAQSREMCRAFSRRGEDRFAGVDWRSSTRGVPLLEGATVTVECAPYRVDRIGDHLHVVGKVLEIVKCDSAEPLIFLRGGFVDMPAIAERGLP